MEITSPAKNYEIKNYLIRILQNFKQPHMNFPTEQNNFSLVSLSE